MSEARETSEDGPLGLSSKHKVAIVNFARIFTYASPVDRAITAASCLAAMGAGLTMPLMYVLFGRLTGTFTGFFQQGSQESEDEFIEAVNETVQQIAYVFLIKFGLTYLSNLGLRMTSLRVSATIRTVYLRSLFSLPISTLEMLPTGQTAAIITTVANNLQLGISERLGNIFSGVAMIVGSLFVAFTYDWLLTIVTSLGFIFIAVLYAYLTPRIMAVVTAVLEQDIQASTVAAESLTPGSARILAAFGAGHKIASRYAKVVDEGHRKGKGMASFVALQNGLVHFAVYATFGIAFWFAFRLYMIMEIESPEPLIVVLLSTILMASSLGEMSTPISAALQAAEAVAIFHTIIDFPKPVCSTARDVSPNNDIVLQNVNFAYPSRPQVKILDNLNLCFPAGKVTAIVGPSGSGKSTIVAIIERWYEFNGDPETNPLVLWFRNGLVSISGQKLTDIEPKWWRNQIGLVQQDNVLFDTTIYKNVEFGLVGTEWEHAGDQVKARMIEDACRDAFADEFISRLPEGYHTPVGQTGLKLSGGQRQRLAIARAIVKRPSILILDEATSAVDARSEQLVQAALDRASKGRTTIVIAHRLSTIKNADNIVVLRKGQVVQQGTHMSLMAEDDGAYSRLVDAQKLDAESTVDYYEKQDTLSPTLTNTETASEKGEPWTQENEQEPRRLGGDGPDDKSDLLEGRVKVLGGPAASGLWGKLWTILSEQSSRWRTYVVMLLGAAAAGAATPLQAYLFATLVSLFSIWDTKLPSLVNFWVLMMVILAVGVGLGHAALGWATTKLGFAISRAYRKEYFSNMLNKPASFFDNDEENSVGMLTSRLSTDPTQLQELVGIHMASIITSSLNLLGCVAVAMAFGWKLTLVALFTTLPIVLAAMIYRMRYEMALDRMSQAVFAESARFACESIASIRTVVSLTLEDKICREYEEILLAHTRNAFYKARLSVMLFSLSDSIPLLCMAFVLWYGGQLLGDHEYTPFQYMVVYIAVLQGGMSAGQWLSLSPNISNATMAADRILATREDDEDAVFDGDNGSVLAEAEKSGVEIEFRDVSFQYPTRPVQVLKSLSLKVGRGQFIAIVGPSGSGKSTIVSLIERFYRPTEGQILLNGTDITTLDLGCYRQGISLVAQEPGLFSGTIRENITLGVHDQDEYNGGGEAAITDENVHQAARDAGIHDFIVSLPEGYETMIGAAGLSLSGGQKQRISLARALVRRSGLLLLDEATSSLDSETEARVQVALDATKGSRTMVVVAHRLATVQNADVIFVLGEKGEIVEQGSHSSLNARKGVYYNMCQMQTMDHE